MTSTAGWRTRFRRSRGEIYAAAGRNEEAARLLRSASFSAQLAAAPESLYRGQWQLGRLARAAGDKDGALRAYRQAVGTLADLRDYVAFGGDEARVEFRKRFEPVYVEFVLGGWPAGRASSGFGAAARRDLDRRAGRFLRGAAGQLATRGSPGDLGWRREIGRRLSRTLTWLFHAFFRP